MNAQDILICPVCRRRWQMATSKMPLAFYEWKIGGDVEALCPVCRIQYQIDALPVSIPLLDPLFERKFNLIKEKNKLTGR